ncbi:Major facilitator superfamily domain-containing protein 12 [Halotydeus destructor]|nr:Major facilitator superfamily domain-containing protein 12 [Halotydeus destructor]
MIKTDNNTKVTLSTRTIIGYSFGHVINDLTGSFWFTYTLIAFKLILPDLYAGLIMGLSQFTDAATTLTLGYLSTKKHFGFIEKYGQLKFYHLVGCTLTLFSFPLVFSQCFLCTGGTNPATRFAYFFSFAFFFQIGWAHVQTSHIALISKLSVNAADRVILTSCRQAAMVASSTTAYLVILFALRESDSSKPLVASDFGLFSNAARILLGLGAIFAILYQLILKETAGVEVDNESCLEKGHDENKRNIQRPVGEWFRDRMFYTVLILYVIGNLYYVITQVYTTLLLQFTFKSRKESLAVVPFVTYAVGFVTSFAIKPVSNRFGSKAVLLFGCFIGLIFGGWVFMADKNIGRSWQIYGIAALNGIAGTSLLVSITSLISKLTKDYPGSGAFVFSVMGFTDKVTNGSTVLLLEYLLPKPNKDEGIFFSLPPFYLAIMTKVDNHAKVTLSMRTIIGYSFGHVINDLTGSFWFTYTLIAFKLVLPDLYAGLILGLGQFTDAITTLTVGYLSTKKNFGFIEKYGQLKFYHLVGTVLTLSSFLLLYGQCFVCNDGTIHVTKFSYFFFFAIFFQAGWAHVQVSHVALISKLSANAADRVILTSCRQAAMVASSTTVYAVALFALRKSDLSKPLAETDFGLFSNAALLLWGIGAIFAVLYQLVLKETAGVQVDNVECCDKGKEKNSNQRPVGEWFRDRMFYTVLVLYVVGNLYYVITQVYTTLLLQFTFKSPKESLAVVPFVTYAVGFVTSFVLKPISNRFGSKTVLLFGCFIGLIFGGWVFMADENFGRSWQIYGVAALNGVAGTSLLVSITSLISKLTKDYPGSGAFVFGVMGFSDKLTNGSTVLLLEFLLPKPEKDKGNEFYQTMIVAITGICVSILIVITCSLLYSKGKQSESKTVLCTKM